MPEIHRSGGTLSTRETAPPADAPIYVRRVRNAFVLPDPIPRSLT